MSKQRVGSAVGSSSSSFKFEGRGEIKECVVRNEPTPFSDTNNVSGIKCGYAITFQPLGTDWRATEAEPVTEFLSAGPIEKFTPGQADNETAEAVDLGQQAEVEGNCLLNETGKEPDKKSKLYKFSAYCIGAGVKKEVFNGWAPNLVGMKAHFYQAPELRGANQKEGTADPTCLAILNGEIYTMPGGTTGTAPASVAPASSVPAAGPAVPPKPVGRPKGSGAAKTASATAPATAPVPASVPSASDAAPDEELLKDRAIMILNTLAGDNPGTVWPMSTFRTKATVVMYTKCRKPEDAATFIPPALDKSIQALFKNAEWFGETAAMFGIEVKGDAAAVTSGTATVTFPAAA
jgi:hypothetical protein